MSLVVPISYSCAQLLQQKTVCDVTSSSTGAIRAIEVVPQIHGNSGFLRATLAAKRYPTCSFPRSKCVIN